MVGPFSLVSRPPKKPLTFSVLADVFFSSRSAMSFFSANQLFADFRYESMLPVGFSLASKGSAWVLPAGNVAGAQLAPWSWVLLAPGGPAPSYKMHHGDQEPDRNGPDPIPSQFL